MVPITLETLTAVGSGLSRPECVIACPDGALLCSDSRGGIARLKDGAVRLLGLRQGLVPNGLARLADGSLLAANVGAEGGVWYWREGQPFVQLSLTIDGQALPEVNFVHVDDLGRLWICISSSGEADPLFTTQAAEGSIWLCDSGGLRQVASGLGWTNELAISPDRRRLYVNETFGRRTLQFDLADDGSLSNRQVLAIFGEGDYPDGIALDVEGGVWVVSIISNRVYRIHEGRRTLMLSDTDAALVARLEQKLQTQGLRRADLHGLTTGRKLNNISSLAFGGPDMRTAFLGSLSGDCLWAFRSPVAGCVRPAPEPDPGIKQYLSLGFPPGLKSGFIVD
ncbi:MAG: SMP-30/gluconolactonase/LRE family protein [Pseudomonadota bacterium]